MIEPMKITGEMRDRKEERISQITNFFSKSTE